MMSEANVVWCMQLNCISYRFAFFFQAEDVIRGLVRSRGLGDVYKRQLLDRAGS